MAFQLVQSKNIDNVQIISKLDDAVDREKSEWDEYLVSYDESKLAFLPEKEPTRFICNFKFNAEEAAELKNSMMSSINRHTNQPNISIGTYQQAVVRFGLRDVQNPDYIAEANKFKIKKEGKYIRADSMALLEQAGLVDEIFAAYNTLISANKTRGNEKNS